MHTEIFGSDTPHFVWYRDFFIHYYAHTSHRQEPYYSSFHRHNTAEFLLIKQGTPNVFIDNKSYETAGSYLVYFPPHVAHFCFHRQTDNIEYSRYYFSFDSSYVGKDMPLPAQGFVLPLTEEELALLEAPLSLLCRYFDGRHRDRVYTETPISLRRREHLLLLFYDEVQQLLSHHHVDFVKSKKSCVTAACEYIDAHFSEALSLTKIADALFVSRAKLTLDFRQGLDIPVNEYINFRRIQHARKLLTETELSLTEVAERCGFRSCEYFIRVFANATGVTPAKFRRTQKQ